MSESDEEYRRRVTSGPRLVYINGRCELYDPDQRSRFQQSFDFLVGNMRAAETTTTRTTVTEIVNGVERRTVVVTTCEKELSDIRLSQLAQAARRMSTSGFRPSGV